MELGSWDAVVCMDEGLGIPGIAGLAFGISVGVGIGILVSASSQHWNWYLDIGLGTASQLEMAVVGTSCQPPCVIRVLVDNKRSGERVKATWRQAFVVTQHTLTATIYRPGRTAWSYRYVGSNMKQMKK